MAEVTREREKCRRAAVSAFRLHEPPSYSPYLNIVEVRVDARAGSSDFA